MVVGAIEPKHSLEGVFRRRPEGLPFIVAVARGTPGHVARHDPTGAQIVRDARELPDCEWTSNQGKGQGELGLLDSLDHFDLILPREELHAHELAEIGANGAAAVVASFERVGLSVGTLVTGSASAAGAAFHAETTAPGSRRFLA